MDKVPFGVYDFFGYVAPGMLVVAGLEWTIGYPHLLNNDLKPFAIALLVLAVYVAGHIAAAPARAVLEDWLARRVLGPPSTNLLANASRRRLERFFPSYFVPLPAATHARITERATQEGCIELGESLFLHARFHDHTLKNGRLIAKLDRFVGMYGFARNMAFACLAVSASLGAKIVSGRGAADDGTRALLLLAAGVFLLYRFLKFYRQYSFELLNNFGAYKGSAQ